MRDFLELTILGSGTSQGIPMIGCRCPVCRSDDPRDRRNRTCAALRLPSAERAAGRVILIDVPPEFRLSAIRDELDRVDAVLLTHAHADHLMGMDDLRRYNDMQQAQIPCYTSPRWLEVARNCFRYADHPFRRDGWPSLGFAAIEGPTEICGVTVTPLPLEHGQETVLGYRIGRLAYCTDCSAIPDSSLALLEGLDVLVLDALRYSPHFAHFNLAQAIEVIRRLKPQKAYLTHIAHEVLHAKASRQLPPGVELAYDGLRVRLRKS
jgi:phosphoribosyl 1,2-cyclic phosphate phosphodiesterase